MPNQYAPGTTSILIRLPKDWKKRLKSAADKMNRNNPGAKYSATSIALSAIMARVEEIEKE